MSVTQQIHIIITLIITALLCSCEKSQPNPPTEVEYGYAEITLDWGEYTQPKCARYLFYDEQGKLVKEVAGVTEAFKDSLPVGEYYIIVHNTDAEHVEYRGMEYYQTAEMYAPEINSNASLSAKVTRSHAPEICQPQAAYGAGSCRGHKKLIITPYSTTSEIVEPKLMTKQVEFQFTVNNANEIQSITGSLNGVSSGIFLSSGNSNTSTPCAVKFDVNNIEGFTYCADIHVFDLFTTPDAPAGTNTVSIVLVDSSETEHHGTFDLTETLQDIMNNNGGEIPADIPLDIELNIGPLNGLTAKVKPWDVSGTGTSKPRP